MGVGGGGDNARNGGRERKCAAGRRGNGRKNARAAEKWKLGLGSETTTKSPSNNQQRAGSPLELAFLELLKQPTPPGGRGDKKRKLMG